MSELIQNVVELAGRLPRFLLALIVLCAGWLGARALRFLVSWLLRVVRFDRAGERTGLSEFLRKGSATYTPSALAGVIVYWLTLLGVLLEAVKIIDPAIYSEFAGVLASSLPNLVAATLIAIVGSLIATFISNFVLTIALNASLPYARLLSKSIKYLGIVVVAMIAFEQVGLGKSIIDFMFEVLFGAVCFGAALAFGLGCKDQARDLMQRYLRSLREKGRGGQEPDLEG